MGLTQQRLRELLDYDSATGVFHWRATVSSLDIKGLGGSIAGSIMRDGYRRVRVRGRHYLSHRLAWLYVYGTWPFGDLDHRNGIRDDNRIANLRPASRSQNNSNAKIRSSNTSGLKGASLQNGRWKAQIQAKKKKIFLGYFDTPEEAHAAYCVAADKFHGKFARAS
jgi:HNH endonuclease